MDLSTALASPLATEVYLFQKTHPQVPREATVQKLLFLLFHHLGEEGVEWGLQLLQELPPGEEPLGERLEAALKLLSVELVLNGGTPPLPKLAEAERLFKRTLATTEVGQKDYRRAHDLYRELSTSYEWLRRLLLLALAHHLTLTEALACVQSWEEQVGPLPLLLWRRLLAQAAFLHDSNSYLPPSWWAPFLSLEADLSSVA